jgi:hypothetical protein
VRAKGAPGRGNTTRRGSKLSRSRIRSKGWLALEDDFRTLLASGFEPPKGVLEEVLLVDERVGVPAATVVEPHLVRHPGALVENLPRVLSWTRIALSGRSSPGEAGAVGGCQFARIDPPRETTLTALADHAARVLFHVREWWPGMERTCGGWHRLGTKKDRRDRSPASVRGVLELLTSGYSVLPALAEARILEFNTQVRPALPDNLPSLHFDRERKVLHINGLYRHGFLLTPTIVEEVLGLLSIEGQPSGCWPSLWQNCGETYADIQISNESQRCLSL